MYNLCSLSHFVGLAVLSAMSSGSVASVRKPRRYREFCGPPFPATRQQRRAMLRAAQGPIRN